MTDVPDELTHDFVAELVAVLHDELKGLVAGPEALAQRLALRLVRAYACERTYWPRFYLLAIRRRDAEILDRYDGSTTGPGSVRALASRHGLSLRQVYAIVRPRARVPHRQRAG